MWLGVDLKTNTKKGIMCLKEIAPHAQNMQTILQGPILNEHENLHFGNDKILIS